MRPSPRDTALIHAILVSKSHPALSLDDLEKWLDCLPTSRRPAGELTITQLSELTGFGKTYIRQKLGNAGVAPVRFVPHKGHKQALYDRDRALAVFPHRKGA